MLGLIGRRLLLLVPVLVGVSLLTFVLSHVVPGDPARLLAGTHAGPAQVQSIRHSYGLDRPLPAQYWAYISNLVRGDLGTALHTQRGVGDDLRAFLPATLELGLAAIVLAVVIGVPLGTIAAIGCHRWQDHLTRLLALCGVSLPVFWVALVLQIVLYYNLGLSHPAAGSIRRWPLHAPWPASIRSILCSAGDWICSATPSGTWCCRRWCSRSARWRW